MDNAKAFRRLIAAVLVRAIRDYFLPSRHDEARAFLEGQWCGWLLIALELDPKRINFEEIPPPDRWPKLEWLTKKGK